MVPDYNLGIVEIFSRMADLLEIEEANPFRVRTYRNADRSVGGLSQSVGDMLEEGEDLTEIPGIGEDLVGKIEEIIQTGSLKQLEELSDRTPADLSQML
ncbi:MAG: hypothetical protein U5K99_04805 [Anaerolineales bacterium]|nr:hypothetical protein [Anaerolineales bacterium]